MSIKSLAFLFILTGFSAGVKAQLFYQFKYKSDRLSDTTVYEAFFVRNNDGSGFIRINFNSQGLPNTVLAELSLREQYIEKKAGETGQDQFYYDTIGVPVFKKGSTNQQFPIPFFRLAFDPLTKLLVPYGVFFKDNSGQFNAGNLLVSTFLKYNELTKTILSGYFDKSDDFYKNLFGISTRGSGEPLLKNAKIILRIVANTTDTEIGLSCKLDMEKLLDAFEMINDFLVFPPMDIDTISGKRFNLANVKKMITNIKPGPNDIVIFYYSGHGFHKDKDDKHDFPNIELRPYGDKTSLFKSSLNIEDIFESIRLKNGRFNLVISDCCNTVPEARSPVNNKENTSNRGDVDGSDENYKLLFCNPTPKSLLITAAKLGQKAVSNGNYGGFFTDCFKNALETSLSKLGKNVSWEKIVEEAKIQTAKLSYRVTDSTTMKRCIQNAREVFKSGKDN